MLTHFKPHVRDILVQTLERGIQAIKAGKIGEPADLGVFVRSIPIALESRLEGFEGYKDSFLEEFSMAIDGSLINPELLEFLTGFRESDVDGDADADADADADIGDDNDSDERETKWDAIQRATANAMRYGGGSLNRSANEEATDEVNATTNAIANESGSLNLSDEDLRRMGVLETTQA